MTVEPGGSDFDAVVRQYGDAIGRLAWGYVDNAADHDDLLQDIFIALWRSLPRFRGDSSVWTFVFRVAHNRSLSFVGRRRHHEPLDSAAHVADEGPAPDTVLERDAARARLVAAIRSLPDAQRQAVMLHLEGASIRQIADVQGTTENNVSVRLTRARDALRLRLGGDMR